MIYNLRFLEHQEKVWLKDINLERIVWWPCSTPGVLDYVGFLFFKPTSKISSCTILFWQTLGLFPLSLFWYNTLCLHWQTFKKQPYESRYSFYPQDTLKCSVSDRIQCPLHKDECVKFLSDNIPKRSFIAQRNWYFPSWIMCITYILCFPSCFDWQEAQGQICHSILIITGSKGSISLLHFTLGLVLLF